MYINMKLKCVINTDVTVTMQIQMMFTPQSVYMTFDK